MATGVMFVFTTLLVGLIFGYIRKQVDYSQSMETLQLAHEHSILQVKTEVQEMTAMHISREIHDNITSRLSISLMGLNNLLLNPPFSSNETIRSSTELLRKSIAELRGLSRSLSSYILYNQGLIEALEEEIQYVSRVSEFTIDMKMSGEYLLQEPTKELFIFRIIQEAFHNIRKHASAKQVWLSISFTPVAIGVSVRDNGIGFSTAGNIQHGKIGAGLKNMQERATRMGGYVNIKSSPGDGTVIELCVPLVSSPSGPDGHRSVNP